ncbi:uncharacterized protein EV420DRAFT_1084066 [Desarmillaria tabescens]|uniref:Fungal-type protein kinase domain-containing protein n=1 Tax=Armillaria tabescens TaxID=1929756 RepID=A0AA39JFX9_ARMTA|nr:uncharacterized protein EV420DRAFT_1084066 [Desarmillaria tabescens]KAK0442042.1 hypothetical protein EV420DRAFT_1084066 [Desarmillaria tabescens]
MNHTRTALEGRSKSSIESPEIQQRYLEITAETRGHFICGPSAEAFVKEHMPWNDTTPESFRQKEPAKSQQDRLISMANISECEMYEKYTTALDNWPLPMDTAKPEYLSMRPQLGNFRDPDADCESRTADHSFMEMQTELMVHDDDDAFIDLDDEEELEDEDQQMAGTDSPLSRGTGDISEPIQPPKSVPPNFPFENDTLKGRETRGQISCYAGATMMFQYRSHLFTIFIHGRFARILRWDRSSAIVSKRFNYTKVPA